MKAYLGWPLRLKGALSYVDAHVTLKYLGDVACTLGELRDRLRGHETGFIVPKTWKPEVFDDARVMVFDDVSDELRKTRAAVEDLRADDYSSWRPHVTFDKSIWSFISYGNLRPDQIIEKVGPLQLVVDNKAVHTFRWMPGREARP